MLRRRRCFQKLNCRGAVGGETNKKPAPRLIGAGFSSVSECVAYLFSVRAMKASNVSSVTCHQRYWSFWKPL